MTETLLGLIALGTLTTALLQVVVIVSIIRSGKKAIARVERIRALVAPLSSHAASIREDIDKMRMIASQQMEKIGAIYAAVEPPLRHGMTALTVLRAVTGFWRGRR